MNRVKIPVEKVPFLNNLGLFLSAREKKIGPYYKKNIFIEESR